MNNNEYFNAFLKEIYKARKIIKDLRDEGTFDRDCLEEPCILLGDSIDLLKQIQSSTAETKEIKYSLIDRIEELINDIFRESGDCFDYLFQIDNIENIINQLEETESLKRELNNTANNNKNIIENSCHITKINQNIKSITQIQNLSTNETFYLNLNESNLKMLKWLEEKGIFKNADIEINFDYNLIIEDF